MFIGAENPATWAIAGFHVEENHFLLGGSEREAIASVNDVESDTTLYDVCYDRSTASSAPAAFILVHV